MIHNIPTTLSEAVIHRKTGPLLRHWVHLASESGRVSKKKLDPIQFLPSLPDLSIYKRDAANHDYTKHLMGDHIEELDAGVASNKTIYSNYEPEIARSIIQKWDKALDENLVILTTRSQEIAGEMLPSIRIALPLIEPEAILCINLYSYDAKYAHNVRKRRVNEYKDYFFKLDDIGNEINKVDNASP